MKKITILVLAFCRLTLHKNYLTVILKLVLLDGWGMVEQHSIKAMVLAVDNSKLNL